MALHFCFFVGCVVGDNLLHGAIFAKAKLFGAAAVGQCTRLAVGVPVLDYVEQKQFAPGFMEGIVKRTPAVLVKKPYAGKIILPDDFYNRLGRLAIGRANNNGIFLAACVARQGLFGSERVHGCVAPKIPAAAVGGHVFIIPLWYDKPMKQSKTKISAPLGASFVVLSSVFYASYGIWTKLMGNFFSGFSASLFRSALVLLILGVLAAMYRQFQPLDLKRNWRTFVLLVLTSVLVWGPLYYAILNAGVGVSLALNYASLVIGMFFFGWLFAGERFTKDKFWSAVLGIIGIALVFSPSIGAVGWLALGAALVSGTCSSVQYVIGKNIPYNSTQSTMVLWAASLVANGIMVFVLGEAIPAFGLQPEWGYLVLFSVASVISTWLFVRGIKLIDAGAAGILGLLEIVFGVVFGVLFFGEHPQPIVLLGVAVIIAAAGIPYIKDFNAKRSTPS